jgi:transcriptional regulator GlxA family with amidase domain
MNGNTIDKRITWAAGHMQHHLAEPLAITHLAALINLSPSHFRQLFRTQIGLGPAQYLQRLRLRRARLLLERTVLTVKEVMTRVGYKDPSHFSRDFRRFHGVAPTTLRKSGVTGSMRGAPDSSSDTPVLKRICESRARDPGLRCA